MGSATDRCRHVNDGGWGKACCCFRPTWDGESRCFWHAAVDGKAESKIEAALERLDSLDSGATRETERLEGAILRETRLNGVSFDRCNLAGADFSNSSITWDRYPDLEMPWAPYTDRTVESPSFRNADLRGSQFVDIDFPNGDFSGADLRGADFELAGLAGANLRAVNARATQFERGFLRRADLEQATLLDANFSDVRMSQANLRGVDAERAIFVRSDLLGTDFRGAALYAAVLTDLRVDGETQFGSTCVYDFASDYDLPDRDTEDSTAQGYTRAPFKKASWTYRRLETVCRQNALLTEARGYYVRGKDLRRKWHWYRIGLPSFVYRGIWWLKCRASRTPTTFPFEEISLPVAPPERDGGPADAERSMAESVPGTEIKRTAATRMWARSLGSGVLTRHGDDPVRIVGIMVTSVAVFTGVYAFAQGAPISWNGTPSRSALADGFILSLGAFAQLGDVPQGVSSVVRAVHSIQKILGYVLLALLVFVLGRRATW